MKSDRLRGCLEVSAIVLLGVAVGAFATSTLLRHTAGPAPEAGAEEGVAAPLPPEIRGRIRVEVRNGSGIPGAAGRMTAFLRDAGFDVVDFGNADGFDEERTTVIDRIGDPAPAREVAAVLRGVPIRTEPDSSLYLDVTVMVGTDLDAVTRPREEDAVGGWRGRLERLRGR